jgi:hypothetical protein
MPLSDASVSLASMDRSAAAPSTSQLSAATEEQLQSTLQHTSYQKGMYARRTAGLSCKLRAGGSGVCDVRSPYTPGGEEEGEERDEGGRERGERLRRVGEHTPQEAGSERGRGAGAARLACGSGGGKEDGEKVEVERGGGGRGRTGSGPFVTALLPLSPLPAPIHDVRRVHTPRGGRASTDPQL